MQIQKAPSHTSETCVHSLLFECPTCKGPLLLKCSRLEENLEVVDGSTFALQCGCGWSGDLIGLAALRHWVDDMDKAKPLSRSTADDLEAHLSLRKRA